MYTDIEKNNLAYFRNQAESESLDEESADDLIFVYPELYKNKLDVENTLSDMQKLFDLIKNITDKNPTKKIPSDTNWARLTIGYYRESRSTAKWQGEAGNRLRIPWEWLENEKEPLLYTCTHEMVHPFFWCSSLHGNENEVWGEGFCDFLRGILSHHFPSVKNKNGVEWWLKKINEEQDARDGKNNSIGGAAAGQFLQDAKRIYCGDDCPIDYFLNAFINDETKIKDYIIRLFTEYSAFPIHDRDRFFLTPKMNDKLIDVKKRYNL